MGKRVTFEARAWSAAPPDVVYGLLRQGATWPQWSPLGRFELAQEVADEPEGVGAVRVFTTGAVHSREEIVELVADKRLSYSAVAGLPMREHRADVDLEPVNGGTSIVWREDFVAKYPGTAWLIAGFLRRFVQQCADGLASHAASLSGELG